RKVGMTTRPVVVIFANAAGTPPPVNEAAEIATEMAVFANADRFWREASYQRTSFKFQAGPWVNLPLVRNAYVWDDRDIDWARGEKWRWTRGCPRGVAAGATCAHRGGGLSVPDVAVRNGPSESVTLPPE